ncbi:hypothetical protein [Streptomyces sp. NPDC088400]|uniref:hypothetical protein n=1 Tax=Streptomyces sp. NPDC088400 TaxID=3365861 RepID=UPI0038289714
MSRRRAHIAMVGIPVVSHARRLRATLNDLVTDTEVACRLAQLRADTRAEGGTPRAADLIENMLAIADGPAI